MKCKKVWSVLLACAVAVSCFCVPAMAAENEIPEVAKMGMRATGEFDMEVPANSAVRASSSFPLEAGETVTIKASYSPFSASVDFGLIAPDGYFYSLNCTTGSFDETIEVDERGNYTFAVRNNSLKTISVSGYVNY